MRMTLREFSEKIGYAPSTISKALNNKNNCYTSEGIKRIIREKASELGYSPNPAARSLIMRSYRTIGVLLPSLGGFYSELVRLMEFALEKKEYSGLFSFWRPEDGEAGFRKAYERIVGRGIDGIITCHYTAWLKDCGTPVVCYGNMHDDIDCIFLDKIEYGVGAVNFLFNLGHRKIGFIGHTADLRCKSYRAELESKGIPFNESWTCDHVLTLFDAEVATENILKLDERPTAILAHNDTVAYSIIHTILKAGLRVPEDISVVGYDNLPESEYYNPPLTTFDLNIGNVAEVLVDTILRRIANPHILVQNIPIRPGIVERGSTGQCMKPSKEGCPGENTINHD
ncbi:MAG: hypothetical protein A2020_01430 [Lentisphaerae bacterium GWF2_45_14]|nr:MAG: hypothetical protein A2020_01430 [Lentisphaerae bacterium GWF2_45_14]